MTISKRLSLLLALLLALAPTAFAQSAGGNIYGTVTDASGAVLPGVSCTVTSEAGTRSFVTGADGNFRFLNLTVGQPHPDPEPCPASPRPPATCT